MSPAAHSPAPRNTIETYSARPEREPPRNESGEIVCNHESCREKGEIFRRPCEWNKHMDKHERPYKCNEPTCEQNPGFTYSGGLLRHMREVHKKGVGPTRKPLYCPHANCIRSTGEGFTRRENLEEHLRRRHSYTGHYSPPPGGEENTEENGEPAKKRRKTTLDGTNGDVKFSSAQTNGLSTDISQIDSTLFANGEGSLDVEEANKQLMLARQTIVMQNQKIAEQEQELFQLRNALGTQVNNYQTQNDSLPIQAAEAIPLATQLQDEVHKYPDPDPNQDPQLNGHAEPEVHHEEQQLTDQQLPDQQLQDQQLPELHHSEDDVQATAEEAARQVELDGDTLMAEKLAQGLAPRSFSEALKCLEAIPEARLRDALHQTGAW